MNNTMVHFVDAFVPSISCFRFIIVRNYILNYTFLDMEYMVSIFKVKCLMVVLTSMEYEARTLVIGLTISGK